MIEAKRHRYIKDKLLVKDLATRVREVLLDPTIDPDFEISQAELSQLLQKGVIDQNQAFLIYHLFHNQRVAHKKSLLSIEDDLYVFFGLVPVG